MFRCMGCSRSCSQPDLGKSQQYPENVKPDSGTLKVQKALNVASDILLYPRNNKIGHFVVIICFLFEECHGNKPFDGRVI